MHLIRLEVVSQDIKILNTMEIIKRNYSSNCLMKERNTFPRLLSAIAPLNISVNG